MIVSGKKNLLKLIPLLFLLSCQEEDKLCTDEYVLSYLRMGDAFEEVYKPKSGSFEMNNLGAAIDSFISEYKDVTCKYKGETLDPTSEVLAMRGFLPEKPNLTSTVVDKKNLIGFRPEVIYGEDNRVELSAALPRHQEWAQATMAQIDAQDIDESFQYKGMSYEKRFTLCPDQRFGKDLTVSVCSGFLVAPDVVVTAGHCVQDEFTCNNFRWVLDFKEGAVGTSQEKVFSCAEILSQELDRDQGIDYAVIRLDRPVTDRKFLRVRSSGLVENQTPLVLIGNPSGLSVKVAPGAVVRSNSNPDYFETNTDSFGGNSGSAVINADTGVVEGILVRGDSDFEVIDGPDGNRCRIERVCAENDCRGEDATKLTAVKGIPLIADNSAIKKGFYTDKNFPKIQEGMPLSFYSYNYGDYVLGGLKFLDRCGIHYYQDQDASTWDYFFVGSCSSETIDSIIDVFASLFYVE